MPVTLWRPAAPKPAYDAVIVGAGGHGLATAYYLARSHGIADVAVLERGWLGGGNMGRNTTVIRSNYLWDASAGIYEYSLKLWEGLEAELDFDVLFSQRGVLNLAHSISDVREGCRRVMANHVNGVDAEWLGRQDVAELVPDRQYVARRRATRCSAPRYQRRGGIARHDRVAWGYARAADASASTSSRTARSPGSTSEAAGSRASDRERIGRRRARRRSPRQATRRSSPTWSGLRLPIQSHPLQALVSELIEPVLDKRHDVQRGPRLRQPGREGRAGDGRGYRHVQPVRPTRSAA